MPELMPKPRVVEVGTKKKNEKSSFVTLDFEIQILKNPVLKSKFSAPGHVASAHCSQLQRPAFSALQRPASAQPAPSKMVPKSTAM